MQKILSKAIAIMLIAILVGFNCITTGVYAANIIEQNNETSESNPYHVCLLSALRSGQGKRPVDGH